MSEIGDHFNSIAVFSLAMRSEHPVWGLSSVLVCRALGNIVAAPFAGVVLDRSNPVVVMIVSDLVRAVLALGFIGAVQQPSAWWLSVLSGLLMAASPFFSAGRSTLLPSIAHGHDLHVASSLTQWTQWMTLTAGSFAGGVAVAAVGFGQAFVLNAVSFIISAWCIAHLARASPTWVSARDPFPSGLRAAWHEYLAGLAYLWSLPLGRGIAIAYVGWAAGGGAAQMLFTVFAERVFDRGPGAVGTMFAAAGLGLLIGGACGYVAGHRASFERTKHISIACFVGHGVAYAMFSQTGVYTVAVICVVLSRMATGMVAVLHYSQLTRYVAPEFRGRVFSTLESLSWSAMTVSMCGAILLLTAYTPRTVGLIAALSTFVTVPAWLYLHLSGRLAEPDGTAATDQQRPSYQRSTP